MDLPVVSDADVFELLDSGLFDVEYYANVSGQANQSPRELVIHYLQLGWLKGLDPSRWFLGNHYLAAHNDVLQSGINPLVHFLSVGRFEGRASFVNESMLTAQQCKFEVNRQRIKGLGTDHKNQDANILVLVIADTDVHVTEELQSALQGFDRSVDVRSLKIRSTDDFSKSAIGALQSLCHEPNTYSSVILLGAKDATNLSSIRALLGASSSIDSPIVGTPSDCVDDEHVALGFRQDRHGSIRPVLFDIQTRLEAPSVPAQFVVPSPAVIRIDRISEFLVDREMSWRELCAQLWCRQDPPRVLNHLENLRCSRGPAVGAMNRQFIELPSSSSSADRWFTSCEQTTKWGFQRLMIRGHFDHQVPGHPLVYAALGKLEELGFSLAVSDEESEDELKRGTVGDVIFITRHDQLLAEHGRRTIEFELSGTCACQTRVCKEPSYEIASHGERRRSGNNNFWNLHRRLRVSCGNPNQSPSSPDLIKALFEVGLRPTSTNGLGHG